MKIVKNDVKIVCEVKGCEKNAEYKLILDRGEEECVRVCSACLKEFYDAASAQVEKESKNENAKAKK